MNFFYAPRSSIPFQYKSKFPCSSWNDVQVSTIFFFVLIDNFLKNMNISKLKLYINVLKRHLSVVVTSSQYEKLIFSKLFIIIQQKVFKILIITTLRCAIIIANNFYSNLRGMTVFCQQPFSNVIWNFKFRVPNLNVTWLIRHVSITSDTSHHNNGRRVSKELCRQYRLWGILRTLPMTAFHFLIFSL